LTGYLRKRHGQCPAIELASTINAWRNSQAL
jgi:hypothetical protein